MHEKFIENRKRPINIGNTQRKKIDQAFDLMWGTSRHTGVSKIDVRAVATAYILTIKLVSDDKGVQDLAKEFDVVCFSTVEILKLMYDSEHINMEKVRQTVSYCQYNNDFTPKLERQYKTLFKENIPPWDYDEE